MPHRDERGHSPLPARNRSICHCEGRGADAISRPGTSKVLGAADRVGDALGRDRQLIP